MVLGSSPPEGEDGADLRGGVGGVNEKIRTEIWIPGRSSFVVKGVLGDIWEAHQTGEAHDANGRLWTRGRKATFFQVYGPSKGFPSKPRIELSYLARRVPSRPSSTPSTRILAP